MDTSLLGAIDDNTGAVDRRVSLAQCGDYAIAASFNRPEINEQHLVFAMVNDFAPAHGGIAQVGSE